MFFTLNFQHNPDCIIPTTLGNSIGGDAHSVIANVCQVIADLECGRFAVGGFGDDDWPVDERTDLAVLLEQLPEAINSVQGNITNSFVVDFFEQGVERTLHFDRVKDQYSIKCDSMLSWQPTIEREFISVVELDRMLVSIRNAFFEFALQLPLKPEAIAVLRQWARPVQ